ncbi:MAG: iron uptake porin [Elainellaceae cyanobacterium]
MKSTQNRDLTKASASLLVLLTGFWSAESVAANEINTISGLVVADQQETDVILPQIEPHLITSSETLTASNFLDLDSSAETDSSRPRLSDGTESDLNTSEFDLVDQSVPTELDFSSIEWITSSASDREMAIAPQSSPNSRRSSNFSTASSNNLSTDSSILNASSGVLTAQTVDELPNQVTAVSDLAIREPIGQVTSVSQLSDVQPTDWAFQALRSLVERYGCVAGYPDGTYRGNRSLSRYEFAAGLNACLDRVSELIAAGLSDTVTRDDLVVLQRLQEEFSAELATLRGRVDSLEAQVAEVEANQFSTTTKLAGEVSFSVNGIFGEERADGSGDGIDENLTFNHRVRLNLNTSFTGRDLLRVRLDALDPARFDIGTTGTNMTRLAFDRDTDSEFVIGKLFYRFPVTDNLRLTVDATRGAFQTNVPTFNSVFPNPVSGAVSRFGRFNPIYYQGSAGAGITANYDFNDLIGISVGYLARNPDDPNPGNGLFNGSYAALAQIDIHPTDNLDFGLTYVRAYYPGGQAFVSGATGSRLANAPFGQIATSANHFSAQSSWRITPQFILSGWAGLSLANAEVGSVTVDEGDDATIFNWAVTFTALDVGKEGNVAGLLVGQPPRVLENDGGPEDGSAAWHLEGFYQYRLNDNISLIPGLLVIINPEHSSGNAPIFGANLRTVFRF